MHIHMHIHTHIRIYTYTHINIYMYIIMYIGQNDDHVAHHRRTPPRRGLGDGGWLRRGQGAWTAAKEPRRLSGTHSEKCATVPFCSKCPRALTFENCCQQFDVLYSELTCWEHMHLYGAMQGLRWARNSRPLLRMCVWCVCVCVCVCVCCVFVCTCARGACVYVYTRVCI
jgi:hypothetical protein